jgi:hypothetical protein
VSDSFLDGIHLCLIVAAALVLLGALVGAVLLRPARQHSPSGTPAIQGDQPQSVGEAAEVPPQTDLSAGHPAV